MARKLLTWTLGLALVFALSPAVHTQALGIVTGTATDATGAPLAGATVNIIDAAGHVVGTGTASATGAFTITNVPVGTQSIQVLMGTHLIGVAGGVSVVSGATTIATVTGVTVTTAAIGGAIITSTAIAVTATTVATGAAIAGVVATTGPASPSR